MYLLCKQIHDPVICPGEEEEVVEAHVATEKTTVVRVGAGGGQTRSVSRSTTRSNRWAEEIMQFFKLQEMIKTEKVKAVQI